MIKTKPVYLPSADEITAACELIRETWNAREELVRRGVQMPTRSGMPHYEIPQGLHFLAPRPRHGNRYFK